MLVADFVGLRIFHNTLMSFVLPLPAWTKANKIAMLIAKALHSSSYVTPCCANCLPAPPPPLPPPPKASKHGPLQAEAQGLSLVPEATMAACLV